MFKFQPHKVIFGDVTLQHVMAEAGLPETLMKDPLNRCTFSRWASNEGEYADYYKLAYVDARKLREDWVKHTDSYAHIKRKATPAYPDSYREDEYAKTGTWHCEVPVFGYDSHNPDLPDFLLGESKCQCDFFWIHDKAEVIPLLVAKENWHGPTRQRFLTAYGRKPVFAKASAAFIAKYETQLLAWLERFPRSTILGEYTKLQDGSWVSTSGLRLSSPLHAPNAPHCPIIVSAWGADENEREYQRLSNERQNKSNWG